MTKQETEVTDENAEAVQSLLTCRQVSKHFSNGTMALSRVDLEVGTHQFLSLLGPSGCGKSTLLRLIAGLSEPSSGTIEWGAAPQNPRGSNATGLSFVFQEPTLMPWATALTNVMLPLDLGCVSKGEARERGAAALKLVGLSGFEGAYPRELSGGMKMRVSLARAVVTRPSVLLLDEPFGALDEITRFKLNNDLLELWSRSQFTVVFVTHSVFESVYLSQRAVLMAARPGRVIADIAIAEPYPRTSAFRVSSAYHNYCSLTSRALERAMSEEGTEA